MANESSPAALLQVITALHQTARRRAVSPQLASDLLGTLLVELPGLGGAALYRRHAGGVSCLAQAGSLADAAPDLPAAESSVQEVLLADQATTVPAPPPLTGQLGCFPFAAGHPDETSTHALLVHLPAGEIMAEALSSALPAAAQAMALPLYHADAMAERREAEDALRHEKSLLDALLGSSADSIYFKDRECRLIRISDKMEQDLRLMGHTEWLGKTDQDLFGMAFGEQTMIDDRRVMETGEPIIGLMEARELENGEVNYTSTTKVPLRDPDSGAIIGLVGITREINELKRSEAALVEERNLLRTLIDNLPDYIFVKDAEGRLLITNLAHVQLMGGTSPDDLIGKTDFDFYPKEMAERYRADELALLQSGEPLIAHEEPNLGPDGRATAWTLTTKVPLKDNQGKVIGLVGIARDITAQKQQEETLAQERTMLRTLIDTLPDNIFIKDAASRIVIDNIAHARLLSNSTPEEVAGKTDFDFFPREMAQKYYDDEQRILQTGEPEINIEEQTIDPDGNIHWLLTTKVPLRDTDGNIVGIVGINRDITAQKQQEETLAQERTMLRTLIDNLPDYIFVKDRQSRILLNNIAHAYQISGTLTPEEVVGLSDFDFFPEEMAQKFYHDEQQLMATGEPLIGIEEQTQNQSGQLIWVQTTKIPLRDAEGHIIGLVGIVRDITARKQAELERERLLAAEREQRALAETLAEISLTLTSRTDLEAMLDEIAGYVRRLVPASRTASIALLEGDSLRVVRWQAAADPAARPDFFNRALPLETFPALAEAARAQQTAVTPDAQGDPRWPGLDGMPGQRAQLVVPIVLRDRCLGLLWAASDAPATFSDQEASRLLPLANAAAIALENARLLQEAQQRARRQERVNVIAAQLQQQADITALLNTALQELGETLGARLGRVRLGVPGQDIPSAGPNGNGGPSDG